MADWIFYAFFVATEKKRVKTWHASEIQKSDKLIISVALCKPIKGIFVKGVQVTFEECRKREEQGGQAAAEG